MLVRAEHPLLGKVCKEERTWLKVALMQSLRNIASVCAAAAALQPPFFVFCNNNNKEIRQDFLLLISFYTENDSKAIRTCSSIKRLHTTETWLTLESMFCDWKVTVNWCILCSIETQTRKALEINNYCLFLCCFFSFFFIFFKRMRPFSPRSSWSRVFK